MCFNIAISSHIFALFFMLRIFIPWNARVYSIIKTAVPPSSVLAPSNTDPYNISLLFQFFTLSSGLISSCIDSRIESTPTINLVHCISNLQIILLLS